MKKTPGTDGAWGLLCVAMLRNENEQVQQPWQIRQTSSDEGDENSAIAPLCEEQGNGDALRVSDENGNDKAVSKTDGETSADSETEGSNTASATDEAGAKEETSDDIVQEETAAA